MFEEHAITIKEGEHSLTVANSHNQMADEVEHQLKTVEKMQQSWENWAEWTRVDQEQDQEEGLGAHQTSQEESRPEVQQPMIEGQRPVLDHSSRTSLDVTPVHTPAQSVRDISTPPLPVIASSRVSTPECVIEKKTNKGCFLPQFC